MERKRTRHPGIYESTARGVRRRYQVVYRTGRAIDAAQRAASFDTLKDARDFRNHLAPVLGSRAIRGVDAEAVAELLATIRAKRRRSRGDGKATVRQVHPLVRRIFNVAVRLGKAPEVLPQPGGSDRGAEP